MLKCANYLLGISLTDLVGDFFSFSDTLIIHILYNGAGYFRTSHRTCSITTEARLIPKK